MQKQDKTRNYLNTFVKTSIFVFFSIVLSKVFTYGYKIVIARNFGAGVYGNFSLAIIITGFFIAFASLGFSDGLVRYISYYLGKNDSARIKYFLSVTTRLMLCSGIVGGLLLFFLAEVIAVGIFRNAELAVFLRIFSFIVPLSLLGSIGIAFLRSYERAKTASFLVGIFHNGIRLVIIAGLMAIGLGMLSTPYSYVLSYVFAIAAILYFAKSQLISVVRVRVSIGSSEKSKLLRELFSYSWPLVLVGLLLSMFYWIDSLVLGYFTNAEIVGFYSAATTLAGLFVMAPDLFSQLFLPVISKELSRNNKTVIRTLTKQITKWIYMINIPVLGVIFFFPGAILNLFFGPEFMVAQAALRILVLGGMFSGFINIFTNLLSAKKETKLILYNFAAFSAVNLALSVLLIKYGMVGVAIGTAVSWIGFYLTLFLQIKKKCGFYPVKRNILRVTGVAIVPIVLLYVMAISFGQSRSGMIISAAVFGVLYGSLLIATKSLDERDWAVVRDIKTKVMRSIAPAVRLVE